MINPKDLISVYRLGFYHRTILPAVNLLLEEFSIGESYTELLKAISPLKASIKRIIPQKENEKLLNKLDEIYGYFKQLKIGDYENDREGKGIYNEIEDLSKEIRINIAEYAEANFNDRASYLFDAGSLLSFWNDILEPPYKLKEKDFKQLCKYLKASELSLPLVKVIELNSKGDDYYLKSHTDIFNINIDILEQLKSEEISKFMSIERDDIKTNALTNLPNLEQFDIDSIYILENPDLPMSLCFVDMDNLKKLNTEIGHDAADEVIKQLAAFLKSKLEFRATVYHRSGDEFLILFQNTTAYEAKYTLERVLSKLVEKTFTTSVRDIQITISCGIASYPDNSEDISELKEKANRAMQKAKNNGKAQVCIHSD